jgi:hypothetical protein
LFTLSLVFGSEVIAVFELSEGLTFMKCGS